LNSPNHCPGLVTTEAPSSIEHRLLVTQLMEMVRKRKKGMGAIVRFILPPILNYEIGDTIGGRQWLIYQCVMDMDVHL